MPTRALILLADGFEEIEAIAVIDLLRRADIKLSTVSLDLKLVTSARNVVLKTDHLIEEIPAFDYDMLVLPGGGEGVKNLKENDHVKSLIKRFDAEGKYIAAICAAPLVLEEIGLLKNKKVTSYPSVASDLKSAQWSDEKVVVDGKLVTSQSPTTAIEFALSLVELLKSKEVRQSIEKAIDY